MNASAAQTEPVMPPEILALQGESLQPKGRIVLELAEDSTLANIPEIPLEDYVARAGGTRKEADRQSMYVLRADGSVISNQGSFFSSSLNGTRLMPGDAIVVPEDLTRTTWMKDLKDWSQIFYQFGLGAAAIKVIRD
jgi:hypothetical protein